jgi:hypothetical protein
MSPSDQQWRKKVRFVDSECWFSRRKVLAINKVPGGTKLVFTVLLGKIVVFRIPAGGIC